MERLDEEFNAKLSGLFDKGGDAVADLVAVGERALADGSTADEDEGGHAEFGGVANELPVIGEGVLASFFGFPGEEASAHVRDGGESGVGVLLADFFEVLFGDSFFPDGDAANSSAGVVLDALGDRPRFVGEGVESDVLVGHERI